MTPKPTPRGDIRCTHGVPYWACARMCPDPAERHVTPVGGWIVCALVILAALGFVAWQVSR